MPSANHLGCPLKSFFNPALGQAGVVILDNFARANTSSYKLNNVTNQNPGASESRLPMADFTICNDMLADFDSHEGKKAKELFKTCVKPTGSQLDERHLYLLKICEWCLTI
jgi:hypothetical protein